MATVKYTTNKIYFIVPDGELFLEKYKDIIMSTDKLTIYDVKTFIFYEKNLINITLDFKNGCLSRKQFNLFMNAFIIDNNVKHLSKAWNKYKDPKNNQEEVKYSYQLCI